MRHNIARLLVIAVLPLGFITACSSSGGAQPILGNPDSTAGSTGGVNNPNVDGGTSGSDGTSAGSTDVNIDTDDAEPIGILQGNWSAGCLDVDGEDFYILRTIGFADENMDYEQSYFADADCTEETTVASNLSSHSLQRTGVTVPADQGVETSLGTALAVDFHLDEATVDNQPIPSEYQDQRGYQAEVAYQIVLVDSNTLYFGDNGLSGYEGTSNDNRPISLDFVVTYSKQ